MRGRGKAVPLTMGTIALMVCLTAMSSADTTATWTVKPGGDFSASGSITLRDTKSTALLRCPSLTLAGELRSGSGLSGVGIGSITSASFSKRCTIVHPTMTATAHGLPWKLNASTYNSNLGVAKGSLTGINLRAAGDVAGPCEFTVDGTMAGANDGQISFSYSNSTGKLNLLVADSNLHVYKAFCVGIFANGDPLAPSGTFTLTPKQGVSSP